MATEAEPPSSDLERCMREAMVILEAGLPIPLIFKREKKGLTLNAVRLQSAIAEALQRYYLAGIYDSFGPCKQKEK